MTIFALIYVNQVSTQSAQYNILSSTYTHQSFEEIKLCSADFEQPLF